MISNSEHNNLIAKYNRVVAENSSLREEIRHSKEKSQEREAGISADIKLIRGLCEEILSKDPKEMVVGSEYSWSNLPLRTLIEKTSESYKNYNKERTNLLMRISDMAESRAVEIEGLKNQISQMMIMAEQRGAAVSPEEALSVIEEKKAKEEALGNASLKIKDIAESGQCEMIYTEDADVTNETIKAAAEAMAITVQAMDTSVPVAESRKKVEAIKAEKARADAMKQPVMSNLEEYEKKMNPVMNAVFDVIGQQGVSIYSDVEAATKKLCDEKKINNSSSRIRAAVQQLYSAGLLEKTDFSTPLKPKQSALRFSVPGHMLYKGTRNEPPVMCEWDKILSEHDNLEHGYSIMEITRIMRESPVYKKVTCENHRAPIKLNNGLCFVADIIGETEKYKEYIEYERGNHIQPDFDAKMNKFVMVSKHLNIIVSNNAVEENIIEKTLNWMKTKGNGALKGIKVKISTVRFFSENNPGTLNSWHTIIDCNTGEIKTNEKSGK